MGCIRALLAGLLLAAAAGGCAAVRIDPHVAEVGRLGAQRGQSDPTWHRTPDDAQRATQQALALAQDGLTRDDAARVAVLTNPALQAELHGLGIVAAELTQAGLPRNPTLDASVMFPIHAADTAAGLAGWLSDLWQLPRRKRVAAIAARQAEYRAALHVMRTALHGAEAWDAVVAARGLLDVDRRLHDLSRQTTQRLRIRSAHGLTDTHEVEDAVAQEAERLVAVHAAEQAETRAANRLAQVLSLPNAADFMRESGDIDVLPAALSADAPTQAATLQTALDNRLDVAMAHAEVEKQAAQVGLERALVWRSVAFGPGWGGDFRRLTGGENTLGPTVSIELPIFDQNQAGIAAAEFARGRAAQRLRAVQDVAAKEVGDMYHAVARTRTALALLERAAMDAAQTAARYTEEWRHKMQLPFLDVLDARLRVAETRRRIIETRQRLNDEWRMLELARLGGSPTTH